MLQTQDERESWKRFSAIQEAYQSALDAALDLEESDPIAARKARTAAHAAYESAMADYKERG